MTPARTPRPANGRARGGLDPIGGVVAGVKGRAQQRGVARREAILRAATEVFAAHGYRGGSLTLIGERAGLTPAGVLRHFGSKQALLLEVLADRDRRAATIAEELAALPPLDAIRGMVRYAELCESEPGIAALFIVLQAEHLESAGEARQFFLQRSRFLRALVVDLLSTGQQDGTIRTGIDLPRVASELIAFMDGASLLWLLDRERQSLIRLYRTYLDRLAAELAAPRTVTSVHD